MSILLFLGVLFVLILVHEWGHFIVAKKTGMKVDEFGIGFPPKLFGKKWHGTEYTFNLLPIGGFVRIKGENAEDVTEDGKIDEDSFAAKSKLAQVAVLIAGVTMNVILAWLIFVGVFMYGLSTVVDESTASDSAELIITQVLENTPASDMQIPLGAKIQKVSSGDDMLSQLTPSSFQSFVQSHTQEDIAITYYHTGETVTKKVQPKTDIINDNQDTFAVGVALSLVEKVSFSPLEAVKKATFTTWQTLVAITKGISSLLIDTVKGTADFSEISGPVGIVSLVGDAAKFGVVSVLMFMAIISLNLAVINMLPFPALDGGRLLMVGIETLLKKPINPAWVGFINLVGFVLLIALMVAVTYNDILKLS